MARYNSVNPTGSIAGGNSIATPASGLLTTITGSGTVTLPSPVLYTGSTQTFYNSTGSAITLSSSPAFIVGPGIATSSTTVSLASGAVITLVSDGANYIAQDWLGGAVVTAGLTATGGTINAVSIGATTTSTGAFTTLNASGTTTLAGGSASGVFSFTSAQASSATNNGAIVVTGGAGIGGSVYVGGLVSIQTASPSASSAMDISGAQSAIIFPTGTTAQRPGTLGGTTAVAGMQRFNTTTGYMEYYNGSTWNSIASPPIITTINPTSFTATGNVITVNGSNFSNSPTIAVINKNLVSYSVVATFVNSSQLTFPITSAIAADNQDPFNIVATNTSGLAATLTSGLTWNATPTFSTAAGTIATVYDSQRSGYSYPAIVATTPYPSPTIVYTVTVGSVPSGLTLNTNGTWSGTASAVGSNTTSSFTVTVSVTTAAGTAFTATRAFSIVINAPVVQTFSASGTTNSTTSWTAPLTGTVQVLVVAGGGAGGAGSGQNGGGGGGGGGVVYHTAYAVSNGTGYSIQVGGGGAGGTPIGANGGDSYFNGSGALLAKGGGGSSYNGGPASSAGGSGGGRARDGSNNYGSSNQPAISGATVYGNRGGGGPGGGCQSGGGGGGAAGVGYDGGTDCGAGQPANVSNGGPGVGITITGSTVYYGGGGGGAWEGGSVRTAGGTGNPGGTGGNGPNGYAGGAGTDGVGGGGGGGQGGPTSGRGGTGVVIVRY